MISIPVRLWLPPKVKILNYHFKIAKFEEPLAVIKFETPIFIGEIEADIYANGKMIEVGEGKISGSYKYSSSLEWTWNNFEFFFETQEEFDEIFKKILSGEPLLEEAQYRKNPPKGLPPSFRDGYGPTIYRDIMNAYKKLFGKPTQALVGT